MSNKSEIELFFDEKIKQISDFAEEKKKIYLILPKKKRKK